MVEKLLSRAPIARCQIGMVSKEDEAVAAVMSLRSLIQPRIRDAAPLGGIRFRVEG
jgi:hypothetical protein